jgi:hypothetical protein
MTKTYLFLIVGLILGLIVGVIVGQLMVKDIGKKIAVDAVIKYTESKDVEKQNDLIPKGSAEGIWSVAACKIGGRWIWNDERYDTPNQCSGGGGSVFCGYNEAERRATCIHLY